MISQILLIIASLMISYSVYKLNKIINILIKFTKESNKYYVRIPLDEYEELTKKNREDTHGY